ncbi:MAG: ABC transporter substrate-binding protein [Candidatus Micrarchaeota archaeon]
MDKKIAYSIVLILAIVGIAALLFPLHGMTGKVTATQAQKEINVAYLPIASDLNFFVAMDQGFFEKYGLKVNAIEFAKSPDAINALVSGNVDAAALVGIESIYAAQARSPNAFKLVQVSIANENTLVHKILVMPNASITKVSQLEGKKVGIFPGGNLKTLTKVALKDQLNTEKINFVELEPNLQVIALSVGQIDALVSLEPVGTIAQEKLGTRVIESNFLAKYIMNPIPTAGSLISKQYAQNNPTNAQAYSAALENAALFIKNNPGEAKKSLVTWLHAEEKIAEKSGIYEYVAPEKVTSELSTLAEILYANRVVKNKINVTALVG